MIKTFDLKIEAISKETTAEELAHFLKVVSLYLENEAFAGLEEQVQSPNKLVMISLDEKLKATWIFNKDLIPSEETQ